MVEPAHRRRAMKHRPFSELTKDWSPERKARVAAMTARLVDELKTEKSAPSEWNSEDARATEEPSR